MSIPQLLHSMCAEIAEADLNAIRKARGFSAKETASRTAFASFYVTSFGVAENMTAITTEEAFTLNLLNETGEVDITFFARLYGAGNKYGTYTQQFKPTFDEVKKNLVRRGLVVMAQVKLRGDTVQLERWRFALPPEIAPYLPSPPTVSSDQPGQINDHTVRRKLLTITGSSPAIPNDPLPLHLSHGSLQLKDQPFSLETFHAWQLNAWDRSLNVSRPNIPASLSPTEAVLKLLSSEVWTAPKSIEPALQIYCFGGKIPSVEKLFKAGWELGLLSRLEIDSVPYYRLAPEPDPTAADVPYPATLSWADTATRPGSVKIDLRLIPIHDLDLLNTLTRLDLENGDLYAFPSPIKLGRSTLAQRNSPLSLWLAEHMPAFGKVLEAVNAKWGKTLLHENLLIARVRDLSLRVQLESELGQNLVLLNEQFIAFPRDMLSSVEKVLKKTGFVIKTVKP
jgi:hypothetical protein